jgi:hypothetical protein
MAIRSHPVSGEPPSAPAPVRWFTRGSTPEPEVTEAQAARPGESEEASAPQDSADKGATEQDAPAGPAPPPTEKKAAPTRKTAKKTTRKTAKKTAPRKAGTRASGSRRARRASGG